MANPTPTVYRGGKRLDEGEAKKFVASQNSPMMGGSSAQAQSTNGGSNGKGRPDIKQGEGFDKRLKAAQAKYNNDNRYGYYDDDGKYVSWFQDATNGGGSDTSGNYFQGAGAISSLLNAAKIRPAGAARERDAQGNYVVDRADIGYRDIHDWFDRGGPQASGGEFQGLGAYSGLANLVFGQQGQRTPYAAQTQQPAAQTPVGGGSQPAGLLRPRLRPLSVSETAAMEDAYPVPDYMYDYPTYAPKPTTTAPASVPDPYSYLFQRQGRPAQVEKYTPTGGTTAATGMTYGQTNQPTFEQFLTMQKQMEAQMNLQPMSEQEYLNMYQTQIQRMGR